MGRGRLLTGEFKEESYPIEKTPVRTPSHVHMSDLPAPTCTLAKHTPGTTRRDFCTIFVQARSHRYIPASSCTAGAQQAFALNPKHLPCFFYATHTLLFEPLACTAMCKFCLIHTSLGIHVFSFTLPLSLPFSHAYTHWRTSGLISQHHTCSLRLSGCLRVSCSQASLKHTVSHQHSHMHHPKCPGAGGAATGTEQQAALQRLPCSRRLTAPLSLAGYTPEPDFGLMDVGVGQEAQGHKEYWGVLHSFVKIAWLLWGSMSRSRTRDHLHSLKPRRRVGRFLHSRGVGQSHISSKAQAI